MTGRNFIPSPFLAAMAKAVRRARIDRGLTRRELAQLARCSVSTIARVERRETCLGGSLGETIVRALDLHEQRKRWPVPGSRRWHRLVGPLLREWRAARGRRASA